MTIKRFFLAFLAMVLVPSVATAQNWDHSEWTDGSVPTPTFSSWCTTDCPTGSAPADSFEPAIVADIGFTESDWISNDVVSCTTAPPVCDYHHSDPTAERKIRVTCEPSTAKHADAILAYGVPQPSGPHDHQGVGARDWSENSTYTFLRNNPSSTCSGGPLNATNYWKPKVMKLLASTGVVVGIREQVDTFYYVLGTQGEPMKWTYLRRNFGFIGGANPMNYNDQARRDIYAASGFQYPGSPDTPAGFGGIQCYRGSDGAEMTVTRTASRMKTEYGIAQTNLARHIKAEDGSDPWGGTCTGSVAAPGTFIVNLYAPGCWDRHNLRSPDGRGHTFYVGRKTDSSVTEACPTVTVGGVSVKFAHVPQLQSKHEFKHAGFADYGLWYLSSDRMNPASTPADPTSKDPCRATGPWFCPFSTFHFDWIYGWKSTILDEAMRECLGITVRGVTPVDGPAECNTSTISKTRRLKYAGTSPDANMSGGCTVILSCTNAVPGNNQRYVVTTGTAAPSHPGHTGGS